MLRRKIIYFLELIADRENWNVKTEYGPYGSYYVTEWIGDQNLKDIADELLMELDNDNSDL